MPRLADVPGVRAPGVPDRRDGGGTLMAAPFDPGSMEITGPTVPMRDGVFVYTLSDDGDLVYTTAPLAEGTDTELVWVTRTGTVNRLGWAFSFGGSTDYTWRISPDGTRIALRHETDGNNDIWVKELPDGPPLRLTFDDGQESFPWWAPDGQAVTYLLERDVWTVPADGTGRPTMLFDGERDFRAGEWSPDGEWLVLRTIGTPFGPIDQPDRDIVGVRPGRDSVAIPLFATEEFAENQPALSPDGRWLAYASNETGRYEVWVRPFPEVDSAKYRVSAEGGMAPRWAHSGRELFYWRDGRHLMAAEIDATSAFRVVETQALFTVVPAEFLVNIASDPYDVAPDDQRFLMARPYGAEEESGAPSFVLVQNFVEELKARVPN